MLDNNFIGWFKLNALIQNMTASVANNSLRHTHYLLPYISMAYLMVAKSKNRQVVKEETAKF
jgi:hypothetical protein